MRMLLYNNSSKTGMAFAQELEADIRRGVRTREPIINWGSSTSRKVRCLPSEWLNTREAVEVAQNKVHTFKFLDGSNVSIPKYTTSKRQALEWVGDGDIIYCRALLRANRGRGISIANQESELVDVPLYTAKVDADREYRVHVFQGEILGISRKVLPVDADVVSENIRNHAMGWSFRLCDLERVHEGIKELGIKAVEALELDFGAVDLLWNTDTKQGYVLEVNTAPAIEYGSTIFNNYVEKFKEWYNEQV